MISKNMKNCYKFEAESDKFPPRITTHNNESFIQDTFEVKYGTPYLKKSCSHLKNPHKCNQGLSYCNEI